MFKRIYEVGMQVKHHKINNRVICYINICLDILNFIKIKMEYIFNPYNTLLSYQLVNNGLVLLSNLILRNILGISNITCIFWPQLPNN